MDQPQGPGSEVAFTMKHPLKASLLALCLRAEGVNFDGFGSLGWREDHGQTTKTAMNSRRGRMGGAWGQLAWLAMDRNAKTTVKRLHSGF